MFTKFMSDPGSVLLASYILSFLIVINLAGFLTLKKLGRDISNLANSRLETYRLAYADGVEDSDIKNTYFIDGPEAYCFVNGWDNVEKAIDLIVEMTDADEEDYTATKVTLKESIIITEAYKRRVASKAEEPGRIGSGFF